VDDVAVLEDSNLMDNPLEWKHFKFEVYPGLKEISFVYQKFNSEQNADMHLDIKV
jgi:hypothetical protein